MRTEKLHFYTDKVFIFILAFIMLLAAISKLLSPSIFIHNVSTIFYYLTNLEIILVASIVPVLEIAIGMIMILLLYKEDIVKKRKVILFFTTILFGLFLIISIYGFSLGLSGGCGCFGSALKSNFDLSMIIRNSVLFIISIYVWLNKYSQKNIQSINF